MFALNLTPLLSQIFLLPSCIIDNIGCFLISPEVRTMLGKSLTGRFDCYGGDQGLKGFELDQRQYNVFVYLPYMTIYCPVIKVILTRLADWNIDC